MPGYTLKMLINSWILLLVLLLLLENIVQCKLDEIELFLNKNRQVLGIFETIFDQNKDDFGLE